MKWHMSVCAFAVSARVLCRPISTLGLSPMRCEPIKQQSRTKEGRPTLRDLDLIIQMLPFLSHLLCSRVGSLFPLPGHIWRTYQATAFNQVNPLYVHSSNRSGSATSSSTLIGCFSGFFCILSFPVANMFWSLSFSFSKSPTNAPPPKKKQMAYKLREQCGLLSWALQSGFHVWEYREHLHNYLHGSSIKIMLARCCTRGS